MRAPTTLLSEHRVPFALKVRVITANLQIEISFGRPVTGLIGKDIVAEVSNISKKLVAPNRSLIVPLNRVSTFKARNGAYASKTAFGDVVMSIEPIRTSVAAMLVVAQRLPYLVEVLHGLAHLAPPAPAWATINALRRRVAIPTKL